MSVKRFVAGVIAASLSTSATAADWWILVLPFGSKPNRTTILADRESIRDTSGFKRAWFSAVHESSTNGVRADRSYVQFDCDEDRYLILQSSDVLASGSMVSRTPSPGWKFLVPDSAMQLIARNVCSGAFYDGIRVDGSSPERSASAAFKASRN